MKQQTYNSVTGFIFLVLTLMHLLRLLNDWPARINTWTMPMWVSWLTLIVAGYLASQGLRKR